jgi:hypothetical protein
MISVAAPCGDDKLGTIANRSRTRWIMKKLLLALTMGLMAVADLPGQEKKDPQSAYEPRSNPGAGQKLLAKFVGEWDVVKTFYPRSGDPVRSPGECRQTMIHEGRFLQSDFVFQQGGKKSTGMGLIGFDADTGAFTSIWTDSRSTRMSMRQSQDRFNGEEIVLFSGSLSANGKETRRSRTVTHLEDNGRKIVHRQYTPGPEGKERLMMELVMTRKAEAPPAHK